MPPSPSYRPSARHAELGEGFFDVVEPAAFPRHILRYRNRRWAARVGLDALTDEEWIAHFGRFEPLPGSFERAAGAALPRPPVPECTTRSSATAAGFLFAQLHDRADGRLLDLGTKGSGRTPWSRGGDGRLTLKGGVRELLGERDAGGAGRRHLQDLQPDRDRRGAGAQRRAFADALVGPGPAQPLPRPHRHLPALRLPRGRRAACGGCSTTPCGPTCPRSGATPRRPARWRSWSGSRANVARTGAQWMAAGFVHGVLEHRQHQRHRRELRLRPVALPADLRPGLHRGLLRRDRALRLRPAAGRRCCGT